MFDLVMSLGYNCEISFRLENFFGKIEAMPFSWSYVLDRTRFPKVLENMELLFAGELTLQEDNMIKCENTQIKFHPRYDVLLTEGKVTEASLAEAKAELCGRVAHLKDKFEKALSTDQSILFVMKVEDHGEENNLAYIQTVETVLKKKCCNDRFVLLVVMEKQAITKRILEAENENLTIRSVKKFAPRKHTDTMGDVGGWKKILQKTTGEEGKGYYKRLTRKRYKWFIAVVKKYLHI